MESADCGAETGIQQTFGCACPIGRNSAIRPTHADKYARFSLIVPQN